MRIRYYSHVGRSTGYGRAAAELALALNAHPDVELELVQIIPSPIDGRLAVLEPCLRRASGMSLTGSESVPWPSACDIAIVHASPRDCAKVLSLEHVTEPAIAYTTWETFQLPQAIDDVLRPFRQVWWPSGSLPWGITQNGKFCGMPLGERFAVLPHAFDPEIELPKRTRPDDDRFAFYFIGAWTQRKNIDGLIRAFCHAFGPQDDVELILRTTPYAGAYAKAQGMTGLEPHEMPVIRVLPVWSTDAEIWLLHASADCYVSASRAEAWDQPAFEALLSGRNIILPCTGQEEFLGDTSAWNIEKHMAPASRDARAKEVRPGTWIAASLDASEFTCRDVWYEPDLLDLASEMRDAYENRRRTIRVDAADLARFTHRAVAQRAYDLCKEILRG